MATTESELSEIELSEIEELRARVAELEATVESLRPHRSDSSQQPQRAVSPRQREMFPLTRRSLLRSLAGASTGAALGAAAVAITAAPAGAADGDNVQAGQTTTATQATKIVRGNPSSTSEGSFAAIWGDQSEEFGVVGSTTEGIGVGGFSENRTGVFGSGGFTGVWGDATFHNPLTIGVRGRGGFGVLGEGDLEASSSAIGVEGRSGTDAGIGVHGTNDANVGVKGDGRIGVQGITTATDGTGVSGSSTVSTAIGVSGSNPNNVGVQGFGYVGVKGLSFIGLGGEFNGGRAAIRLVPRGSAGRPTTGVHERGELVIDSAGALFVCVAGGTPGTWRRVTTTAA